LDCTAQFVQMPETYAKDRFGAALHLSFVRRSKHIKFWAL
jgi:hypothetical protein